MITIRDIAERLELSVSTVGRALADHPRISRPTKERVRAMADELGYIANAAARVMRGGSSRLIGLLVPDIRSTFYAMTAQVLSKCVARDGYHLALAITDDDASAEFHKVRELLSARVAGIVMIPSAAPRRDTVELVRRVPHVQLLRRMPALGDWFGLDDETAIADATRHLIGLGHRRIGYVGDVMFPTGKARYRGFRRAHADAGHDAGPDADAGLVELGAPDAAFGAEAVERLLARRPAPTAIVTSSVLVTLGVAERLATLGVAVPDQLSFVGFGDGAWQQWWGPGLTTLRLPVEDLAVGCGLWLLHGLGQNRAGGRAGASAPPARRPHVAVTPAALVVRGSTAPPRPCGAGGRRGGRRPPP